MPSRQLLPSLGHQGMCFGRGVVRGGNVSNLALFLLCVAVACHSVRHLSATVNTVYLEESQFVSLFFFFFF